MMRNGDKDNMTSRTEEAWTQPAWCLHRIV